MIHWFRKGLRLHDNPALLAALKPVDGESLSVKPVFVLDPWFVQHGRVGQNRWRFLQQTLENLDSSLKEIGTRLYVIRGEPLEVPHHPGASAALGCVAVVVGAAAGAGTQG